MLQSEKNSRSYKPRHALEHLKRGLPPREVLFASCFIFLSLGKWFNLPLFLVIVCGLALITCGCNIVGAIIGSVIGCLYQWAWGIEPFWWSAVVMACLPLLRGVVWKRNIFLILSCALFTVPGIMLFGYQQNFTVQEWILSALQLIGCSFAAPCIVKGLKWLQKKERDRNSPDDILCLMIPVLAIVSGMTSVHLWYVNFGYAFAIALLLTASHVLSVPVSLSAGFSAGLTLLLSGHGTFWCIFLSLAGIVNSWTKLSKRLVGAVLCMFSVLFASYLLAGSLWKDAMYSCAFGIMLYLILPETCIRKVTVLLQNTSLFQRADNPYLEERLHSLIKSLSELSQAMPETGMQAAKNSSLAEELTETLCDGCENIMLCWHDSFESRKREFEDIESRILFQKDIGVLPHACSRAQLAEKIMNNMLKREQENALQLKRVRFEQQMLNIHFSAVSGIVEESIQEGISGAEEDAYLVRQVNEVLKLTKFPACTLFAKLEHGHYKVGLRKHYPFHLGTKADLVLKHVGTRLQRELKVTHEDAQKIIIEEIPAYQITVGKATACAISAERKSITPYAVENGDAIVHQMIRNGCSLVALSDGMGHGEGAGKESAKTLELLTICLKAGYTRMQAIATVNGIMLSSTGGERFATVDLCMFDLWNGNLTINKLGAAQSLVVQGQHIHLVEGEALPLGIIEQIVPMEHCMHLSEGDMVLLISDGVTDAFDNEQSLAVLIRRYLHLMPQQIADSILQDALIQSGGLPADDMTVICIKLEKRKKGSYTKRSA